ncbi:MAG TPA: hypothetical protein PK926_10820 [Spirochaetota bacterium]|nr:hypothetical protein [Spirochaetota bacterium]HPI88209.1 hypothetical protein [Spirochaetota bacterium]HPR47247.1 hypothetical protein [Spirochaetota bacterium]
MNNRDGKKSMKSDLNLNARPVMMSKHVSSEKYTERRRPVWVCAAVLAAMLVFAGFGRAWAAGEKAQAGKTAVKKTVQTTKPLSKAAAKAVKDEKQAKDEKLDESAAVPKKKMLLGFDLGYFVPLQDLGDIVDGQVSGRIFFQYQDIIWWFGLGVDGGFTQLDDNTYDGNIRFLYFIAHPFLTFPLGKGFDLQLLAGVGLAVIIANMEERNNVMNDASADMMIDGGVNVMYTFMQRYTVGVEAKYYHIFENTDYNGVEVSVFFGIRF